MDKQKEIEITQKTIRKNEGKTGIMADMLNQEIDSLIKSFKCGNCVHLSLCMAQKGGVNLQLASENNCCYYQPKIDKDSVVLTREEYDSLRLQIQQAHNKGVRAGFDLTKYKENSIKQASKETAEKILKWLKDHCAFYGFAFVEAYFKEQFNAEIKE